MYLKVIQIYHIICSLFLVCLRSNEELVWERFFKWKDNFYKELDIMSPLKYVIKDTFEK